MAAHVAAHGVPDAHQDDRIKYPFATAANDEYQQMWRSRSRQAREQQHKEVCGVCSQLREALLLREQYMHREIERDATDQTNAPDEPWKPLPVSGRRFAHAMRGGVMHVWDAEAADDAPPPFETPPSLEQYTRDLTRLVQICSDAAVNGFCHRRLQKLEARFELHLIENNHHEVAEQRKVPHRDFYNIRKVDTHVHLAAAMNQKHLLRFIKKKMRVCPYEVVAKSADGRTMTLSQVFDELGIRPYDLNLDSLDMHADPSIFNRFDKFNLKYNPLGKSKLREIFLKSENLLNGRYFAELTQELFDDLEESKYQAAEYRISIYGRSRNEWDGLAAWVVDHKLYSPNNRWLVQIPRLYGLYHATGTLQNFEQMLENIFLPLFEVSIDPASHPKLHLMLQQVVGFDSVDDESKPEGRCPSVDSPAPPPAEWTTGGNPHYAYYCYYVYANLHVLNQLRAAQGLSQLCFRPHAGEAGELNHLHAAFLTARGINHGINLRKSPSLQYLYYLKQVGLALSPLSNNALFLQLKKNPFYEFFAVGLNVSLSTDDPLMFHHTKEPLMEEYCVAKQVWRLSSVDLAEISRNSVLGSSFEGGVKAFWLGAGYRCAGVEGNDIERTNVPNLRVEYRHHLLTEELDVVNGSVEEATPVPPRAAPALLPSLPCCPAALLPYGPARASLPAHARTRALTPRTRRRTDAPRILRPGLSSPQGRRLSRRRTSSRLMMQLSEQGFDFENEEGAEPAMLTTTQDLARAHDQAGPLLPRSPPRRPSIGGRFVTAVASPFLSRLNSKGDVDVAPPPLSESASSFEEALLSPRAIVPAVLAALAVGFIVGGVRSG